MGSPKLQVHFSNVIYSTCDLFPPRQVSDEQEVAELAASEEKPRRELGILVTGTLIYLNAVVESRNVCDFAPTPYPEDISGDIFGFNSWGEGCYWHRVSRCKEMLLNILQSTRQPPRQRMIWPKMSVVLRTRNSA